MRKEVPEIGWGDFEVLRTSKPEVLAIRYDWRGNSVVVVHNLSANPCEIRLNTGLQKERFQLANILSADHSVADESGTHCVLLEPYGYRWYRAGGLSYVLNRTDT
ncbi:MAG: alpha-glucosidase C-terminal domain-containing protein [Acidobacteriaceae bacterium]|nr:alpha-glucosidase C-terminal domain-containing protein [Acidobacteriaceae bacterium]